MNFFALILALALEQVRPLPQREAVDQALALASDKAAHLYSDGSVANGRFAWLMMVGGAGLVTLLLHFLLLSIHPALAFVFSAAGLYLVLGFRHDEALFTDVQRALADDDADKAARILGQWRAGNHAGADADELARIAVERAVVVSHRGIFGVLFWFVVLPGPTGAVMYRMARHLHEHWGARSDDAFGRFGEFSRSAFGIVDWLPARLSAVAFSVIGNFEDAMYCWRTQASWWRDRTEGVVLAAAAGALGLRLGMPVHEGEGIVDRPELGLGATVDVDQMPRVARLIWRVLLLYVLLLALLVIAGWVSR